MGKTTELCNKTGNAKRKFHSRIGRIKDKSTKDLTEAEEIKNRCKYTEKNYTKKGFNELYNHDSVVTHLEPDLLKYEIKQILRRINTNKASTEDGMSAK